MRFARDTVSQSLTERHDERIAGVLSCHDRVVITGTLPTICYAEGMTRFLYASGIKIFNYLALARTLRGRVRDAGGQGRGDDRAHRENHVREVAVVHRVPERRGEHSGLVHIISAMEACDACRPWHDKATYKTFIRPDSGKCLHYYFYFMDATFGLIYLRVPTYCPFRLQFHRDGRNWLARRLTAKNIDHAMVENAFVRIDD